MSALSIRRSLVALLALSMVSAGLAACEREPTEADSESKVFEEDISRIEVDSNGGAISFNATDTDNVELERELEWSDNKPASAEAVDDGVLSIEVTGCPLINQRDCFISYHFNLPHDVDIEVETEAGNIELTGMQGDIDVKTEAGNVTGKGLASENITARSDAGNVNLRVVDEADSVVATSEAGNVTLNFASPPGEVTAETKAGNSTVIVPSDGTVYQVDTKAHAGSVSVEVATDDAATRTLDVSSSVGNVRVDYR
ncbi:DUF4097 family beta strand repeat-containing protein [Haloglycomyces albus]|uniref:DUF4097 family beta strand repeat-containing protein n=1 Tax=Haloglycomyces albus TaxID=526067 RepID=UPI00046D3EDE|nr:DUF4097 family beta strand repeat-containing protein [Haloglycomyces albus]